MNRDQEMTRAPTVTAIVMNAVKHDARVIKEAETLAEAGFEVRIVGLKDNQNLENEWVTPGGVPVTLLSWRGRAYQFFSRMALLLVPLGVIAYILLVRALKSLPAGFYLVAVEVIGALLVAGALFRFAARWANIGARYRVIEAGSGGSARSGDALLSLRKTWTRWVKPLAPKKVVLHAARRAAAHMRSVVMAELLAKSPPDVVHCHDIQTLRAGHKAKRSGRSRLVFDSHELFDELSLSSAFDRRSHRRTMKRYAASVDAFITVNDSIGSNLAERYPQLPTPVIVKNATIPSEGAPTYDGRMHEAAGIPEESLILLYQGGFSPKRGLEVLARSGPLLPDPWVLVFMGWGALESRLRQIAGEVDPEERKIRFLPKAPQDELRMWTAGATLGVIPYENVSLNHWLCTPNKLWEYPDAGVPMLVSPFPEMRVVVEENSVGWLLEDPLTPKNVATLVSAIGPSEIDRARDACMTFVAHDNWSIYGSRLVDLYRDLMAPREATTRQRVVDPAGPPTLA